MNGDAPILEFDPVGTAVIEPSMVRRPMDIPVRAVACFFSDVVRRVCVHGGLPVLTELETAHGIQPVYGTEWEGEPIAVYHPGVGAPLGGIFLEDMIASGCRLFVTVGGAGGLVPELTVGHVVLPTSAVRDEGTSYHYLPAGREVAPSPVAVAAVERVLRSRRVPFVTGKAWTTDAPYRETKAKVARRVAEGCLAVDMEAAAFFAIARHRGVHLAAILAAADDLSQDQWDHRGMIPDTSVRERLFWLAVEACASIEPS